MGGHGTRTGQQDREKAGLPPQRLGRIGEIFPEGASGAAGEFQR